jgi:AraC-like DNA-binding protein
MRFGMILLGTIAVLSVIGTLVIQGQGAAFYEHAYSGLSDVILFCGFDHMYSTWYYAALFAALCLNLLLFPPGRQREEEALSPLLTRALDYMNRNLFTIQSVDEVARALFVSPSYLYAQFRSCLHQSPKKYIQDKRLLAAQRMLRAGGKPAAVSRECGFREYTTFYRGYTALFGHSPSAEN